MAGLDPRVTEEMYALIRKLNREDRITVIMISHDLQAAVREASHILHVGQEIFFGTTAEYLGSDAAERFLFRKGGETV